MKSPKRPKPKQISFSLIPPMDNGHEPEAYRRAAVNSLTRILLGFGAGTACVNAFVYVTLHDVLKHHGRVQLALFTLGIICIVVALLWRHCFFLWHRWEYSRLQTYRVCERCGDIQFL